MADRHIFRFVYYAVQNRNGPASVLFCPAPKCHVSMLTHSCIYTYSKHMLLFHFQLHIYVVEQRASTTLRHIALPSMFDNDNAHVHVTRILKFLVLFVSVFSSLSVRNHGVPRIQCRHQQKKQTILEPNVRSFCDRNTGTLVLVHVIAAAVASCNPEYCNFVWLFRPKCHI